LLLATGEVVARPVFPPPDPVRVIGEDPITVNAEQETVPAQDAEVVATELRAFVGGLTFLLMPLGWSRRLIWVKN